MTILALSTETQHYPPDKKDTIDFSQYDLNINCQLYQLSVPLPLDGLEDVSPEDVNGVSDAQSPGPVAKMPVPQVGAGVSEPFYPLLVGQAGQFVSVSPVQRQEPFL